MSPLDQVVEARPELALSIGRRPTGPGWQSSDLAFETDGWAAIVTDYRRRMGGAVAYAASSCALQSHAARIAGVAIWAWLLHEAGGIGPVWQPDAQQVLLRYELGSARAIDVSSPRFADGDVRALSTTILAHLAPLISQCVGRDGVPRRTAFGNVAASCASPFRRLADERRGAAKVTVLRQAEAFFSEWPYHGLIEFP